MAVSKSPSRNCKRRRKFTKKSEWQLSLDGENMKMSTQIEEFLKPMFGKPCCRQRVWRYRSLHLGFGKKIFHGEKNLVDTYYGEWEIGTYYWSWRILKNEKILCGSGDLVKSIDALNAVVEKIDFGRIIGLKQITDLDVRAEFDTGLAVDFLEIRSDEEESFDIFYGPRGIRKPGNMVINFSIGTGWTMEPAYKGVDSKA
jgi:hypothetical protein